jgi:hypothetical protein
MRPVVRGTHYAVSSMKPEASQAAERILRAGGNAFDAIVAGQAVLGLTDAANNGVGSDAVVLVYEAASGRVFSLNAEGTAPKLATIEWYQQNQASKIPVNDTLLSGTVPGIVDAWYILLDRWGTMSFEQVLADAIDIAENGFPINDRLAPRPGEHQATAQVPVHYASVLPGRDMPQAGQDLEESPTRTHIAADGGSREGKCKPGPARGPSGGTRSFLQGRHRARNGRVLRKQRRPVPLRGFRVVHRQAGRAGVDRLPRLPRLQECVLNASARRTVCAQHSGRLRPQETRPQQRGLHTRLRRGHQAGHGGSR